MNKMGGRRPEGHITDPRNTKMEETTRKQKNRGRRLLRKARAQKGL